MKKQIKKKAILKNKTESHLVSKFHVRESLGNSIAECDDADILNWPMLRLRGILISKTQGKLIKSLAGEFVAKRHSPV
jgi:hypothetical protein